MCTEQLEDDVKLRRKQSDGAPSEETVELFVDPADRPDEESSTTEPSWFADRDRLATRLGIGLMVAGFIFMGSAWYGASGLNEIQQQFPYLLSGAIPGLALALIGGGIVIVRDIRRERAQIASYLERLTDLFEQVSMTRADAAAKPTAVRPEVVLGANVFHSFECRLLQGKNGLATGTREEAMEAGLSACRICSP
jgi:hypothetical protein